MEYKLVNNEIGYENEREYYNDFKIYCSQFPDNEVVHIYLMVSYDRVPYKNFLKVSVNKDIFEQYGFKNINGFKDYKPDGISNFYSKRFEFYRGSDVYFEEDVEKRKKSAENIWKWLLEILESHIEEVTFK